MKGLVLGCSHIHFLKENYKGCLSSWTSDIWDTQNFMGGNSMPIYHEKMVNTALKFNKSRNIFIFPFRSIAYNTVHVWMKECLDKQKCIPMTSNMMQEVSKKKLHAGVERDLIKDEKVVNIQNDFFKMWITWYITNIENVKFAFWCHYGFNRMIKENPPHITYNELYNSFKNNSIDICKLDDCRDKLYRDGDWHPSLFGYEKLRDLMERYMI
jgi:hypothetical protein